MTLERTRGSLDNLSERQGTRIDKNYNIKQYTINKTDLSKLNGS